MLSMVFNGLNSYSHPMNMIPRFRSAYTPRHCEPLRRLLFFGWTATMIAEHLGKPDSRFPDEEVGFGAERAYLGGIGIPELRAQNPGADSVYRQVKREQLGQYIKIDGF